MNEDDIELDGGENMPATVTTEFKSGPWNILLAGGTSDVLNTG